MPLAVMVEIPYGLVVGYQSAYFLRVSGFTMGDLAWGVAVYRGILLVLVLGVGRFVDRVGTRPILRLACVAFAASFFLHPLVTVNRWWIFILVWALIGVGDSMWSVAATSTLFHSLPASDRRRAASMALAPGLTCLASGIAPLGAPLCFAVIRRINEVQAVVHLEP